MKMAEILWKETNNKYIEIMKTMKTEENRRKWKWINWRK